jgi:hypothetical protein
MFDSRLNKQQTKFPNPNHPKRRHGAKAHPRAALHKTLFRPERATRINVGRSPTNAATQRFSPERAARIMRGWFVFKDARLVGAPPSILSPSIRLPSTAFGGNRVPSFFQRPMAAFNFPNIMVCVFLLPAQG